MEKSLQELEALKQRLENDIFRSRMQDHSGLNPKSPLLRNHREVVQQIKNIKESAGK